MIYYVCVLEDYRIVIGEVFRLGGWFWVGEMKRGMGGFCGWEVEGDENLFFSFFLFGSIIYCSKLFIN